MTADLNRDDPRGTLPHILPGEPPMTTPNRQPHRTGSRTTVLALVAALVLIVAVVLVLQLRGERNPEPAPTAGPTTSAPSLEPSPSSEEPPTAEEAAVVAADQAYSEYLRVVDEIALVGADVAALEGVAVGDALEQARVEAENYRVAGISQVGELEVASLEPQTVSLAATGGAVPEVVLDVCLNASTFDLVQDGKSVLDPNRPVRVKSVVTVRDYPERGGWLVASIAGEAAPC